MELPENSVDIRFHKILKLSIKLIFEISFPQTSKQMWITVHNF
jgi:hypothetical protein